MLLQKQVLRSSLVGVGVALLMTALLAGVIHTLSRRQWNVSLHQTLSSSTPELANQLYIYSIYKIKLDPVLLQPLRSLDKSAVIKVIDPSGNCILGDCSKKLPMGFSRISVSSKLMSGNDYQGDLLLSSRIPSNAVSIFLIVLSAMAAFLAVFFTMFFRLSRSISSQILDPILKEAATGHYGPALKVGHNDATLESQLVEVEAICGKLRRLRATESELITREVETKVAHQVAHDIRAPVGALKLLIPELRGLDEQAASLAKSAIDRVTSIANDLLKNRQGRQDIGESMRQGGFPSIWVREIILEYRTSFPSVQFEVSSKSLDSNLSFTDMGEWTFKRLLSNLLSNSVESEFVGRLLKVDVSLRLDSSFLELSVQDNGRGMPEDVLNEVRVRPFSYGKKQGTGIGLDFVRQSVQLCGGRFDISSRLGEGTRSIVVLPTGDCLKPFSTVIEINKAFPVGVIDDDPVAIGLLKNRLDGANVEYFASISDFKRWIERRLGPVVVLSDLKLGTYNDGGFDIYELVRDTCSLFYLVTTSFNESRVQKKCIKHRIKLVPKPLVPYVHIIYR